MRQRFLPKKHHQRHFPRASMSDIALSRAIANIQVIQKQRKEIEKPQIQEVARNGFNDFAIAGVLKKNIAHIGYTTPTPIQDQTIPLILEGKDIIGIANTGTGKTAAFLIPLIQKVFQNKSERVFIIVPTRELAMQIYDQLRHFSKGLGIRAALCVGGVSIKNQKNILSEQPSFVIGTPGRIKDLIQQNSLQLSYFHTVVLDEVDRMVDIGFIQDVKYFISLFPLIRQSLFFSATVNGHVKELLQAFVRNAVTVSVKTQDTAENINQDVIHFGSTDRKIDTLHDLLSQKGFDKVLLFGRTKWGIHKLTKELLKRGFRVGEIHGNRNQNQRQKVLEQFKNGQITILLATDVASRGLDIADVTHVINYDLPESMEDYIHRIGRTGRANKKGIALSFIP